MILGSVAVLYKTSILRFNVSTLSIKLRYVESKVDRMLEILEFTPTSSQWDFGEEVQTADILEIQGSDRLVQEQL